MDLAIKLCFIQEKCSVITTFNKLLGMEGIMIGKSSIKTLIRAVSQSRFEICALHVELVAVF